MPRRPVSRWLRTAAAILLFAALAISGGYQYWHHLEYRFQPITEGTLYQSAAMPLDALTRKVEDNGIRTVIDLRSKSEATEAERRAVTELGVEFVHLPSGQLPTADVVDSFLEIMGREENQPVLVHCKHGEGRSSLLAAIYRIEFEDWPADRTRRATRWFPFRGSFSPSRPKGQYLLNYVPRQAANTSPSDGAGRGS